MIDHHDDHQNHHQQTGEFHSGQKTILTTLGLLSPDSNLCDEDEDENEDENEDEDGN